MSIIIYMLQDSVTGMYYGKGTFTYSFEDAATHNTLKNARTWRTNICKWFHTRCTSGVCNPHDDYYKYALERQPLDKFGIVIKAFELIEEKGIQIE